MAAALINLAWAYGTEAAPDSVTRFRHVRPNRAIGGWVAEVVPSALNGKSETVSIPLPYLPCDSIDSDRPSFTPAGENPETEAGQLPPVFLFLETGNGEMLATKTAPVEFPSFLPFATMTFQFGFTTDEEPDDIGFFDTCSVTFQSDDGATTILLLAVDATGVAWAPPNPGGTFFDEAGIVRPRSRFATNITQLATSVTHSVTIRLPSALIGKRGTLYLDLFDNLNDKMSKTYLRNLFFTPAPVFVDSSSLPQGPYAQESGTILDATTRSLSLPQTSHSRFFRLRSSQSVKIVGMRQDQDDWIIQYGAGPGTVGELELPVLQSSAQSAGPYADEPDVRADAASRTLRFKLVSPARFYRLRSEVPLKIERIEKSGDQIRIIYE